MTLAALDPWIALAKQWQPLLAGLLAVLASIIFAAGITRAARIRAAARPMSQRETPVDQDLRTASEAEDGAICTEITRHLEILRSLVRSALSALSAADSNDDVARSLCTRIAALQWQQFQLPTSADKSMRNNYSAFLHQFELLQNTLRQEWSGPEASSLLIQLNAHARSLESSVQTVAAGSSPSHSLKQK
jgi:hypothetical protein